PSCTASSRPSAVETVRSVTARSLRRGRAAPLRSVEPPAAPAGVDGVQVRSRRDDLVDRIENVGAENDVGSVELALELLHRARADDRRRDGRMAKDEGESEVDERQARV